MKRSELQVGADLLHAKPTEWINNYVGSVNKVTVVAVEPHAERRFHGNSNTRDDYYQVKGSSRADVLVEWHYRHRSPDAPDGYVEGAYLTLVRLTDLRGPYEETLTAMQARREAARQASAETAARRNTARKQATATVDRARRIFGLHSVFDATRWDAEHASVRISADELNGLLDRLERAERELAEARAGSGETRHLYECGCPTPYGPGCQA